MIDKKLNLKAKQLAEKSLNKGFDWQAFVVLSMAELNLQKIEEQNSPQPIATPLAIVDDVEESNVDENTQLFYNTFLEFANKKKNSDSAKETLIQLTNLLTKIVNELYYSCNTEEKRIIKLFINELEKELE